MPKAKPVSLTVAITYDDGRIQQNTTAYSDDATVSVLIGKGRFAYAKIETADHAEPGRREYDRNQPVALDQRDPGNADAAELTEPLSADDDVYALVYQDQGDAIRETAPVADQK